MVPAWFAIGNNIVFQAGPVSFDFNDQPAIGATATYQFLDKQTRVVVDSGSMTLTDPAAVTFQQEISETKTGLYDPNSNPNGIKPFHVYVLRTTIVNGSIQGTRSTDLLAVLDPPDSDQN